MNQRLQHIVEHYDEMCIGTDEHFRFHCKQCGKCCINREDILLNPKDLYNISKELGLAPRDTIAHYCEVYLGQNSRIPIVRLKPRGSIKRCPLLRDRKCSVHNAKPTVCALFPLGRSIKLDAKETDPNAIERARIQYIINPIECGDRSEEHTVREWVESFGIPIHDNDFIAWQKALFSVRQQIVELEKMLPDKSMERVWSITYQALYLNYDIQEDFRKQFQKTATVLSTHLNSCRHCGRSSAMNDDRNRNQIIRIDARNCFVESLNDAFEIGKAHFTFASYDLSKPSGQRQTNSIQIYIDMAEVLELCRKLMGGELRYLMQVKKKMATARRSISGLAALRRKSSQGTDGHERMGKACRGLRSSSAAVRRIFFSLLTAVPEKPTPKA